MLIAVNVTQREPPSVDISIDFVKKTGVQAKPGKLIVSALIQKIDSRL